MFGKNLLLEFEIIHEVLKIGNISLIWKETLSCSNRCFVLGLSCMAANANGTFSLSAAHLLTIS